MFIKNTTTDHYCVSAHFAFCLMATPGDLLLSDDFERATLAPDWAADNVTRSCINTATANSPTRSMYTRNQVVTVTSSVIDLMIPGASVN